MGIIAGPDTSTYESIQIIKTLTSDANDNGAAVSSYDNERVGNLASNLGITDLGPIVGTYDPEWQAWLSGEI